MYLRIRTAIFLSTFLTLGTQATVADVIAAQNAIIANNADCHPGPNTDALGTAFRYDDTHLNDIGQSEFAQMLVAMLA